MTRMRLGLIVIAASATAIFLAWPRTADVTSGHRQARQLVLRYTLSRTDNPVIVVGDSIVEASTLPRSVCGHPIVNAGINGASTASDLGNWLAQALDGKRAALIVAALGTNDALVSAPRDKQHFADRYGAPLAVLSKLTPRLFILQIPPVEAQGRMTAEMRDEVMATINSYNSTLPDLAARTGATFIALPTLREPYTIDGIHLNSNGYLAWEEAIMKAAATICG